jgi:hypothetical protein
VIKDPGSHCATRFGSQKPRGDVAAPKEGSPDIHGLIDEQDPLGVFNDPLWSGMTTIMPCESPGGFDLPLPIHVYHPVIAEREDDFFVVLERPYEVLDVMRCQLIVIGHKSKHVAGSRPHGCTPVGIRPSIRRVSDIADPRIGELLNNGWCLVYAGVV